MERDFLDELMEESTAMDPNYPRLVEQAMERRAAARVLSRSRVRHGERRSIAMTRGHVSSTASIYGGAAASGACLKPWKRD